MSACKPMTATQYVMLGQTITGGQVTDIVQLIESLRQEAYLMGRKDEHETMTAKPDRT